MIKLLKRISEELLKIKKMLENKIGPSQWCLDFTSGIFFLSETEISRRTNDIRQCHRCKEEVSVADRRTNALLARSQNNRGSTRPVVSSCYSLSGPQASRASPSRERKLYRTKQRAFSHKRTPRWHVQTPFKQRIDRLVAKKYFEQKKKLINK